MTGPMLSLYDKAKEPKRITEESEIARPQFVALGFGRYRMLPPPYSYYDPEFDVTIGLEEGFECDLATAPRPYRHDDFAILPPAIHDKLYRTRGLLTDGRRLTRKQCDQIFYRLMRAEGVNWFRARAAYLAVRSFGWILWRKGGNQ